MNQSLCILGVNHRSASLAVREKLAFRAEETAPALGQLMKVAPAVTESALISTCGRMEVLAVASEPASAHRQIEKFLLESRRVSEKAVSSLLYRFDGRAAIQHLFRVGASLDSMVLGEPQILGQLKDAYVRAAEAGTVGAVLHRAFHRAFSVAKQVRSRTGIGHGAVSVSAAAVKLAAQIFETLSNRTALLLGAGRTAELTAHNLLRHRLESLIIVNRSFDRAVALARELGGTAVPLDRYKPYLKLADIVIGSLAVERPILMRTEVESALKERRFRPVFFIDLGVPRNFDPEINQLAGAYLYDLDDLGKVVLNSQTEREREAERASAIIDREVDAFERWLASLRLVPTIKAIRSRVEWLSRAEFARHRGWLASLAPEDRNRVEALTQGILNKILHQIVTELRRAGAEGEPGEAVALAHRILGMGDGLPECHEPKRPGPSAPSRHYLQDHRK